jgi:arginine deiminase
MGDVRIQWARCNSLFHRKGTIMGEKDGILNNNRESQVLQGNEMSDDQNIYKLMDDLIRLMRMSDKAQSILNKATTESITETNRKVDKIEEYVSELSALFLKMAVGFTELEERIESMNDMMKIIGGKDVE